jgi:putative transposase
MYKRLNIRLYPTEKQKIVLEKHFNAYRFCYNLCLEYKSHLWKYHKKNISAYEMQAELFQVIKDVDFLKGCKVECLRQAALDVDTTFKKFYKGKGYPKFKSKKNKQAFVTNQSINIKGGKLSFFKNLFKFKTSDNYIEKLTSTKIKQCSFSKDKTGKYWASCLIEDDVIKELPISSHKVGIDLGLKYFLITSDGEFIPNNKFSIRNKFKLRRLQRRFSKSKKGGKNREKLRVKIAKIHQKTTNQRQYFFHQVSNKLIRDNQSISCEALKVKNMLKNRRLSRAISDVAWGEFVSILEYKCLWYNRELIKIPSSYASSKICYNCGNKKEKISLSERTYHCECCKISIDRDLNASYNIRDYRDKCTQV